MHDTDGESEQGSPGASVRVLLADGDAAARTRYAAGLASHGYEVEQVDSGLAAVARCRRPSAVDVLVLEVHLPDLDGLAVMRRVLEDRPDLPVVIHTEMAGLTGEFTAWCADAYLVKTGEVASLAASLKRVLAARAGDRRQVA